MNFQNPRTWDLWDIFFPPLCSICGDHLKSAEILFCSQCWADAPIVESRDFPKLKYVDFAYSAFRFTGDNIIRQAVHALKYEAQTELANDMARRMLLRIPSKFLDPKVEWTPVPQHWLRRMERSFNQSSKLASSLADLTRRDAPLDLLKKVRNTPTQTARTMTERRRNVYGAFALNRVENLPESVLLIDDVITTGATVDECARILKEGGVNWVGAYSFALAKNS